MWLGGGGKALISPELRRRRIGRAATVSNRPRESEGIPAAKQAGTTSTMYIVGPSVLYYISSIHIPADSAFAAAAAACICQA